MHGLKDHSSRYAPVATELAARGYAVHAFDLRGHGRSDGQRVWVSPFDRYVDDLEDFIHRVEAEEPGQPVFLFGHSMGGAIATLCALERTPELRGLVLSGAALTTGGNIPPLLRPVADFVSRTGLAGGTAGVLGALPGPLGHEIASAPIFKLDNADFSRDPAVVQDMGRDPLIYQPPGPAITALGLVDAMGRIQKHMTSLRVPLLALHGSADKLTNPDGSRELYERAASADKMLTVYPGLFHDLLHEPEKEQVKSDLFAWLDARSR
jgi:alpha-beta hydrolase superfamily lysophospholipase